MRGRKSGDWERVEAARRQARLALGRDADSADLFDSPPMPRQAAPVLPEPMRPEANPNPSTTEYVLTLGEVASRLNMDRRELEAMIERGEVATLQGEFIRVISTREVERLRRVREETP